MSSTRNLPLHAEMASLAFFRSCRARSPFPAYYGVRVFFNFFSERNAEILVESGVKNMLAKFVAREMEQRESIEKRESLYEIIA